MMLRGIYSIFGQIAIAEPSIQLSTGQVEPVCVMVPEIATSTNGWAGATREIRHSMSTAENHQFDCEFAIVGGGIVGLSVA